MYLFNSWRKTKMAIINNLYVLWTLLVRDALVFKKNTLDQMINAVVWGASIITVAHFIMPSIGVNAEYGAFMFVGSIAVWGLFETISDSAILVADIAGHQQISYFLTLPIPQSFIFIRLALFNAYKSSITPLPIFAIGKYILGNSLPLNHISFGKLLPFYLLINIFYGFFGLFLASISENLETITKIRTRYLFPLWFLGCYNFPWATLQTHSPLFAKISLINPIVYVLEGLRSTILNPTDYMPFWTCAGAIVCFTFLFGYCGVQNLKRRLDCL